MSNNNKQSKSSLTFHGFRGVDGRVCRSDPPVATRLENFRIRSDGSLEKRCGYRPLYDAGAPIRAMWTGRVQGAFLGYLLLGNVLYSLDFSALERTALGEVETTEGHACIFFYRGSLYVLDATGFYRLSGNQLVRPTGYAPLIGKDWSNNEIGLPYEPKNILNPNVRISYVITDPPSLFLCAPDEILSIRAVYVNGVFQTGDKYSYDPDFNTVNVPGLQAGDRVQVYLTLRLDYTNLLTDLYSSTQVTLFGDANCDRLFFWGGRRSGTIFCSSFVESHSLKESQLHFPDTDGLYIPEGFEFQVGSGHSPVTGAIRHFDRLLLFTEAETWMASSAASGREEFPAVCVNPSLGCAHPQGLVLTGNDPVSIGEGGIWQWTGDTEALNHRNARCLSKEIEGMFSSEELSHASLSYHRADDTLWVLFPHRMEAWLLDIPTKNWVCYTRIHADRLLDLGGQMGFLRGNHFYVFDPACVKDQSESGAQYAIVGTYESNLVDFGSDRTKKLSHLSMEGDLGGGSVRLDFFGDGIATVSHTFENPLSPSHARLRTRAVSGRFHHGSLRLTAEGEFRPIIHSLTLGLCKS